MLTNAKRNLGLLLAVATLSAVTALVPTTAGAAASKVSNLGTTVPSDPYTAPNNDAVTTACPMSSAAAAVSRMSSSTLVPRASAAAHTKSGRIRFPPVRSG